MWRPRRNRGDRTYDELLPLRFFLARLPAPEVILVAVVLNVSVT